jgi:hypothetical protein
VHELSTRVARSVEICKNRKRFANDDGLWRERTRACIETTASLICFANANPAWFGGISELLRDIGSFERIQELSLARTDELFVTRWTCLSLVAIRQILADNGDVHHRARLAVGWLAEQDDTGNNKALTGAQKIDETFKKASDCLKQLHDALTDTEHPTEEVKEILRGHESEISELEQINTEADRLAAVDDPIFELKHVINQKSHHIISQFPGILDDFNLSNKDAIPFSRLSRDPRTVQFMWPGKTLKTMCTPALTLRNNILEGQGDADAYKELLKDLERFSLTGRQPAEDQTQRQLWRLLDFCDGGGLGVTVKLFFLCFSELLMLSTSPSKESHSALYTGTFRAITSDWRKHKDSVGTQNLLLNIAMSRVPEFDEGFPAHIVNEFLSLLGNIFEGQTGPHIDRARQEFKNLIGCESTTFRERMLEALTPGQAQSLAS